MPFIAAGIALADTSVTRSTAVDPPPSIDVYRVGFTAGGGLDYAFGYGFVGRVEYLFDRFGTTGFGGRTFNSEYFDLEMHTVRGALAYKLGGARLEPASLKDGGGCCGPDLWSGAYLGAFAGYQDSEDEWTSDETNPAARFSLGSPIEISSDGFTGGGFAGANIQQGNIVLGLEGDIGSGNSERRNLTNFEVFSVDTVESAINWTAHGRIRVGHAFGTVLPFVATGVALADTTITLFREGRTHPVERDDLYRVGFSIGGGVDYQFRPNIVGRVEYLYDQYMGANYGASENDSEFFELDSQTVRGALAIKFN